MLPYVDTIEMPWGAKLIPVDELERVVAERRRVAQARPEPTPPGRPPAVPEEVVSRIQAERAPARASGRSPPLSIERASQRDTEA